MFINKAYAQAVESSADIQVATGEAPGAFEAFVWNMGMVLALVILFYMLLIRPQQKRFKEHSQMLTDLQTGDEVITGGGLIGTIEKIVNDDEIVVRLGDGLTVTALRSTIQAKHDTRLKNNNDNKKKKDVA